MLRKPFVKAAGAAFRLRHTAETCRVLHYTLAFRNCKLAQEKIALARSGRDPIWIAAAGIEEC